MQLSSGKNSGPLLVTALVLVILFAVYYYVVLPKQDEAEIKQSTVDTLNSEISTMKEQIALIEGIITVQSVMNLLFVKAAGEPQD